MLNLEYEDRRRAFGDLLRKGRLDGIAVEVGVDHGDFSEILLKDSACRLVVSVDTWRGLERTRIMTEAMERLAVYGDRSIVMRAESAAAASLFKDQSIDFVYIDTFHAYNDVVRDINAWWPKVRPGGLFAGHDYVPDYTGPDGLYLKYGVIEAVNEFATRERLPVSTVCDFPSWYFWRPAAK